MTQSLRGHYTGDLGERMTEEMGL